MGTDLVRGLIDAAEADDEKAAKQWLRKGASINGHVPGGWTALHGATRKGNKNMVKFLLSKSVKIDLRTSKEETPLHISAFNAQLACCKLLVKNGADLKAKNKQGRTALEVSILRDNEDLTFYLEGKASKDAKAAKKRLKKKKFTKKKKGGLPFFVPPLLILFFLLIVVNFFT